MISATDEAVPATSMPKILLVEDQRIIGLATAQRIKLYGYEVALAGSGEEAVDLAATRDAAPERFDLILMDVDLGRGMDGVEASQLILKEHRLPVVFLTSHSDQDTIRRVREISRYGYVLKSSGDMQLQLAIETALDLFSAHTRIEERDRELEAIYESVPVSLLIVSPDMRVAKANRQARLAGGVDQPQVPGSLVGAVLRCVNALDDPEACGLTPHCDSCPLRHALIATFESGTVNPTFEAVLPVERGGKVQQQLCSVSLTPLTPQPDAQVLVAILEKHHE